MTVHHTIEVDERRSVQIDPTCDVGPFCYLRGPLVIGARTRVSPHVTIGTDGEHRSKPSTGTIYIGADCTIREFTAIQRGTGDRDTLIGNRCYVMDRCHISHDTVIGDDVTVSPCVVFGGHTRVGRAATIGISAMTHQSTTIGAGAMIGMGSVVTKDIPPFCLVMGNPARVVRWNVKGIERLIGSAPGELWRVHPLAVEAFAAFEADRRDRSCLEAPK